MSTDFLELFGRSCVEEHPGTLADRLVAAEFAIKFQNDLSVKRRTKLYGHANTPTHSTRRCTAARITSRCLARLCTREIGDKVPTTWLTKRSIARGATPRAGDRATLRAIGQRTAQELPDDLRSPACGATW